MIQPIKFINEQKQQFIYNSNCIEFWLPINESYVPHGGRYYISSEGRVYDTFRNNFLNQSFSSKGYLKVNLIGTNGQYYTRKVHRLLLITFYYIPGCENLEVNHRDGIKTNNTLYNLEWNSGSENRIHAINNDLENTIFGAPIVKLSSDEVWDIKLLHSQNIYSYNQIIDILGLREKGAHRKLIERIVNGKSSMYSGDYK